MQIEVVNTGELAQAAQKILSFASGERIFVFYGDMGAGKTTLINALCKQLAVEDQTSSPTFSIVNEYKTPQHTIYHFDFYRIRNQVEAYDLGYEDYFYSGDYCFIEWPERIPDLLPDNYIEVFIDVIDGEKRSIRLKKIA
ncbi:tRNA (adenosine(37)-N6)-threonylcarbamoyltransferase complex ATPase subunit type 1 TsaE [Pseudopedobacter beijingensis]|uniref:tRNA threonylcarbamoyladenosine biosynthesis protein TsaE n=1 Tax=Pseudopedobacter beijingensis TaxID=1207056 RepID=A0ABW4IBX5_9SPHI